MMYWGRGFYINNCNGGGGLKNIKNRSDKHVQK